MILSIVVLSHHRPELLSDCLDSLSGQTFPRDSLEIVVVDDGPTPKTRHVVELFTSSTRFPVRYCPQPHSGISAARNRGIREARGEFVAIVADDYLLPPEYAKTAVDYLRSAGSSEVVRFAIAPAGNDFGSRISHHYYNASLLRRLSNGRPGLLDGIRNKESSGRYIAHDLEAAGGAVMRRSVFEEVGLFDESLVRCEDTEFTRRLRRHGMTVCFDNSLSIYHQYRTDMMDTLKKCYETGRSRRRLKRTASAGKETVRGTVVRQLHRVVILVELSLRSRQKGAKLEGLLALPFMALFELSNKFGYIRETVAEVRRSSR